MWGEWENMCKDFLEVGECCSERQNNLLCNFTLRFSRQNLTRVPLGNFNTSSTFDILKIDSHNFHIHKSFIETAYLATCIECFI